MSLSSYLFQKDTFTSSLFLHRIKIAFIIVIIMSCVLVGNLFYLQIICFKKYYNKSNENYIKIIPTPPIRGIIYDRNGIPLALNNTVYQLELIPNQVDNLKQTINALRPIVDLTDDDISNFKKKYKLSEGFSSVLIKNNLTEVQQAKFVVNQFRFFGVKIKSYQRRYYPYHSALTHVIGYVSKINNYDIKKLHKSGYLHHYIATNEIGKLGIEKYYENILHGQPGYTKVVVDSHGKIIREIYKKEPQSGKNITLTLDIKLQLYIERLLVDSRAAVVAVDPRNGEIRALVSTPSYDPNLFVNGISNKEYHNLLKNNNFPFINRVTQGLYPPASTVKPYILISALTLGIIDKNFSMFDPGWWCLPGSAKLYRGWKKKGHGWLNITKALEESSDTFFYQIAYNIGIDRLSEWMTKFGYGQFTGIDLYEEKTGIIPTRDWKMRCFKKPWYHGDTISVGIGQGYWAATPIQMSKALMILINNGKIYTPHLLQNQCITDQLLYNSMQSIKISEPHTSFWEIVKDGMFGVANRPNGTANNNFASAIYKIAAKSGTAQLFSLKNNESYNVYKINERLRDHKMMIAFAPYDKPTIAIVVIIENGSSSSTVGEITRQILDYICLNFHK